MRLTRLLKPGCIGGLNDFAADLAAWVITHPFKYVVRQVEAEGLGALIPEVFDECGHIV